MIDKLVAIKDDVVFFRCLRMYVNSGNMIYLGDRYNDKILYERGMELQAELKVELQIS